jgi:TPR repeat protein
LKAVEKNDNVDAQRGLGDIYRYGLADIPCNYEEAIKWYIHAATEWNDEESMYELGLCYSLGLGVVRNDRKAVRWFKQAAVWNYKEAIYKLGESYFWGNGVKKNLQTAAKWYRKAAKLGHADSMYALAICYFDGEGVTKSCKKGLYWLEQYQEYF